MASQGILWDPKLSRQGKRKRKEEERFVESLRQAPWEDPEDPEDPKAQRKYTCYVTMSGHSFRFTVFLYIMIYIYIHYHTLYMHIHMHMYAYIHKVGLLPPIYLYTSVYIYVYIYIRCIFYIQYPPKSVGVVIVSRCAVVPGGRRRGGGGSPSTTPHGGGELHQAVIPHQNVMRASCINIGPIGYENTC